MNIHIIHQIYGSSSSKTFRQSAAVIAGGRSWEVAAGNKLRFR